MKFTKQSLPYVEPPRRPDEYADVPGMLSPESRVLDWRFDHLHTEKMTTKLRSTPSMWRNITALYLRCAGVETTEISVLLGIGDSRVNGVVAKSRALISGTMSKGMRGKPTAPYAKSASARVFTKREIEAHRLNADVLAAAEAEVALSRATGMRHDVVSAALKLGRKRLQDRAAALEEYSCNCGLCVIRPGVDSLRADALAL